MFCNFHYYSSLNAPDETNTLTTWFTKKGMTGKSEICRGLPRLALYVLEVWILISRCWIGYWRRAFFQHVWKNSSFKNSMVDGGPKKSPFTQQAKKVLLHYKQIPKNPAIWFSKIPGFWLMENPRIPGIPLGPAPGWTHGGWRAAGACWSLIKSSFIHNII